MSLTPEGRTEVIVDLTPEILETQHIIKQGPGVWGGYYLSSEEGVIFQPKQERPAQPQDPTFIP